MPQTPINTQITTRIIPGLKSAYEIVSLPYWAWYWLEDFMRENRISYRGILKTFETQDVNSTLEKLATLHHHNAMQNIYNLANDNVCDRDVIQQPLQRNKKQITNLPKIYKLFGFMPCATTLEAVWERRHYKYDNRVR